MTTPNPDVTFGDRHIAAFLQSIPPDDELTRLVAEHDRMEQHVADAFARRGAIPAKIAEIDRVLVDANGTARTSLLMERVTFLAERDSIVGQVKEATRRQVTALLTALQRITQLAQEARQYEEDRYDAKEAKRPVDDLGNPEYYAGIRERQRKSELAKRCALADQAIAQARKVAQERHPNLNDLSPSLEQTWGDAVRISVEHVAQRAA